MKKFKSIIFIILFISCSTNQAYDSWHKVKESKSIKEYQNFLITNPDTDFFIEAIDSLRILWKHKVENSNGHYGHGNSMTLLLNNTEVIYFNRELLGFSDLADKVKYAILNPDCLENLPETKQIEIDGFGIYNQSRGIVDIMSVKNVKKDFYSQTLKNVISGFYLIRNDLAVKKYGIEYEKLDSQFKNYINQAVPIKIRMERYIDTSGFNVNRIKLVEPLEIINEPKVEI